MNLVTLSGYIRKKNKIKRTTRDEDSLTFILEVTTDKVKDKLLCVVFNRLVRRVDKAVSIGDKVLIHGYLKVNKKTKEVYVIIEQLELLDFVRYEDKERTPQQNIQIALSRFGR
jgi:hypothetical protein